MSKITTHHTEIRVLPSELVSADANIKGSLCGGILYLIYDTTVAMISSFIEERWLRVTKRRAAVENRKILGMRAAGVIADYDFYKEYAVLFNQFRSAQGRQHLMFDVALNELAAQRAIEISQPRGFSHAGIEKYNVGENIAMMASSSDSPRDLIALWARSPEHRTNMLSYGYHKTGIAKNGKYAVQIFD